MRREIVISYSLYDMPEDRDDSWQYDFERDLVAGAEAGRWAKIPIEVEYRDVP